MGPHTLIMWVVFLMSTQLPAVVILLVLLVVLLSARRIAAPSPPKGVPSPQSSPYLGTFLEMDRNWDRILDWFLDKSAEYGYRSWAMCAPRLGTLSTHGTAIMISTPENLKHILKDEFDSYEKGLQVNEMLTEFLGDGIFTSDGDKWKFHRKVASNMFSRRLLRNSSEVALNQALKLRRFIESHGSSGKPVDIQRAFYAYTMDTFASIAFGLDLDSLNESHVFAASFDHIQKCCNDRIRNPAWKWCRLLGLTQDERDIQSCRKHIVDFTDWVIKQKRRDLEGEKLGPDIISRFIASNPTISNKELRDIVMNFIIAGRDTTAATLSWCMYELLKEPALMEKVTQELREKEQREGKPLTECGPDRLFEIIEHVLPFTKAVTNETLRLHPSVPKDIKYAVKANTLPDGTQIEPGMAVIYLPFVMGRNPDLWPEPLVFKPERWLTEEQVHAESGITTSIYKPTRVSDYTFPTFNAGPRLCLGRPLAYVEVIMALLAVLPAVKLTEAHLHTAQYTQTIVPSLLNGLHVV